MDLNADLGESFGRWTLGDDAALMPLAHLGEHRLRLPRRRPARDAPHGCARPRARRRDRRARRLARPGRLRPAAAGGLARGAARHVVYQAGALRAFVEAAGGELQHVKPHGALYTMVVDDERARAGRGRGGRRRWDGVALLMPPAARGRGGRAGIPFVPEGYVDLDYDADGKLVLERVKQLRDPQATAERAVRLVREGRRDARGGESGYRSRASASTGTRRTPSRSRGGSRALEEAGVELAPLAGCEPSP